MAKPVPTDVNPHIGHRGDKMTVTITGNHLENSTTSFGQGITVVGAMVAGETNEWSQKIEITNTANYGDRDVVVTNSAGQSGTLTNGFTVVR